MWLDNYVALILSNPACTGPCLRHSVQERITNVWVYMSKWNRLVGRPGPINVSCLSLVHHIKLHPIIFFISLYFLIKTAILYLKIKYKIYVLLARSLWNGKLNLVYFYYLNVSVVICSLGRVLPAKSKGEQEGHRDFLSTTVVLVHI